jgi:hypothetical protein
VLRILIVLLIFGAVALAQAQLQPSIRPDISLSNDIPDAMLQRVAPPLSREEAERMRHRLRTSLQQHAAAAPRSAALRSSGLHPESDAVEQADAAERAGTIGPIGVGVAQAPPYRPRIAVDPALAEAARLQLQSRLHRNPTEAELRTELQAFDARVARANTLLATNRTRIAKAFASTGTWPPAFDRPGLDPVPPDRQNDTLAARDAFRTLFRAMLTQPDGTAPTATRPPLTGNPTSPAQPDIAPRLPAEP